jgi:hypothetical protein
MKCSFRFEIEKMEKKDAYFTTFYKRDKCCRFINNNYFFSVTQNHGHIYLITLPSTKPFAKIIHILYDRRNNTKSVMTEGTLIRWI